MDAEILEVLKSIQTTLDSIDTKLDDLSMISLYTSDLLTLSSDLGRIESAIKD